MKENDVSNQLQEILAEMKKMRNDINILSDKLRFFEKTGVEISDIIKKGVEDCPKSGCCEDQAPGGGCVEGCHD